MVVGMQLDQGQRLQYAIMQMSGHVGALLLAFLQRAFHAQIADQRHDPRHDCQQHADNQRQTGQQRSGHGHRLRSYTRTRIHRVSRENDDDATQHSPQLAFLGIEPKPGDADSGQSQQQRDDQGRFDAAH